MQWNAMKCNEMQWNAMECNGMQWNAMECNGMQWNAMECNGMHHEHVQRAVQQNTALTLISNNLAVLPLSFICFTWFQERIGAMRGHISRPASSSFGESSGASGSSIWSFTA